MTGESFTKFNAVLDASCTDLPMLGDNVRSAHQVSLLVARLPNTMLILLLLPIVTFDCSAQPASSTAALSLLLVLTMLLRRTIYVYSDSSCTVSTANVSVTYSATASPICYDETDLATSVTTFEKATLSCVDSQVNSVATSGTATGCASTDTFTTDGTATFTSAEYEKYLAADCYTYLIACCGPS